MRILPPLLLALCLSAAPALAQSPLSVDQIISRLKPNGALGGTTRGIAPDHSKPNGAVQAPSVDIVVQFASNSADLSPQARTALANLGSALSSPALAGDRFRIEGHTDTVGTQAFNEALSTRRAEAVVAFLVDTYHVARDRLMPVGLGFSQPAVPTGPGVDEPRNRRVRVVNLGH
jgi:outer membrane protein OmpA-like peptidoglycan-associated protein